MIVTVTRNAADLAAIRQSGLRAIAATTVDAGIHTAAQSAAQLLVVDLHNDALKGETWAPCLREAMPCPLIVRHDVNRKSVAALYELANVDADIRSSFRRYDELCDRVRTATSHNDANATPVILRCLSRVAHADIRDFIGVMAILGERPVMQGEVAATLGLSVSSFRRWLSDRRVDTPALPRFPTANAVFVALHFMWRRERLGWPAKRAASAGGFADEKSSANYLRYHLGKTTGQLARAGGFDALMTHTVQLFSTAGQLAYRHESIRRI
jgi:hypothetical protein